MRELYRLLTLADHRFELNINIFNICIFFVWVQLQVLLRAIDASVPEGVTVQVLPHEEYHEEVRYVPDQDLKALKQELENLTTKKK